LTLQRSTTITTATRKRPAPSHIEVAEPTKPKRQRAAGPGAAPAPARRFKIDCTLGYQLDQPTSFLFQIHAQHGRDQEVLADQPPPLKVEFLVRDGQLSAGAVMYGSSAILRPPNHTPT